MVEYSQGNTKGIRWYLVQIAFDLLADSLWALYTANFGEDVIAAVLKMIWEKNSVALIRQLFFNIPGIDDPEFIVEEERVEPAPLQGDTLENIVLRFVKEVN